MSDASSEDAVVIPKAIQVLIAAVFIAAAVLVTYVLITIWPSNGQIPKGSKTYKVLGTSWTLTADQTLIVLVIFAGTLGGLARCLLALTKYIGRTGLKWRYLLSYITWPALGALFGFLLYVVIKGGFIGLGGTGDRPEAYGFIAVGLLAGLFADLAATKLRQVARVFFLEKPEHDDVEPGPGGDRRQAN